MDRPVQKEAFQQLRHEQSRRLPHPNNKYASDHTYRCWSLNRISKVLTDHGKKVV